MMLFLCFGLGVGSGIPGPELGGAFFLSFLKRLARMGVCFRIGSRSVGEGVLVCKTQHCMVCTAYCILGREMSGGFVIS